MSDETRDSTTVTFSDVLRADYDEIGDDPNQLSLLGEEDEE